MQDTETEDNEVGKDLFGSTVTPRTFDLATEMLAGEGSSRYGERAGCEADTIEDYMRSDGQPLED